VVAVDDCEHDALGVRNPVVRATQPRLVAGPDDEREVVIRPLVGTAPLGRRAEADDADELGPRRGGLDELPEPVVEGGRAGVAHGSPRRLDSHFVLWFIYS